MSEASLDEIRSKALGRIEKTERNVVRLIAVAALVEAAFLAGFLALMDFHDRLHWLMLLSAGLVYGTLGIGLVILGVHQNNSSRRIIKAIELIGEKERDK